jgi:hypothetical protein
MERLPAVNTTAALDDACCDATSHPAAADSEVVSIFRSPAGRRSRAERQTEGMPWLSVKLPWGLKAKLLNISSTGLLLESGSKLTAGSVTELTLCGPGAEVAVAVSFVRSELAEIDRLSVKYHTAVAFKEPLKILEVHASPAEPVSSKSPLSQLLSHVSAELDRAADGNARAALERSVRHAVGATAIRILDESAARSHEETSIAFPIRTTAGSPSILLASFAPGLEATADQLALLKAAAGLAGAVLDFDAQPLREE